MINSKIKKNIINVKKSSYKCNYAFIYEYIVIVKN
jgi:hypothetical protein